MLSSVNLAAEAAGPAKSATPDAGLVAPIERLPTAVTAFVGRTLKGPVNAPTLVADFAQFQQQFGGPGSRRRSGYAVEQFFENGGRQALIVRVANGARAPSLRLPAGKGELVLQGLQSRDARIPARLGRLRRHRRGRHRPVQPRAAATARARHRAHRGAGDPATAVGATWRRALGGGAAGALAPGALGGSAAGRAPRSHPVVVPGRRDRLRRGARRRQPMAPISPTTT